MSAALGWLRADLQSQRDALAAQSYLSTRDAFAEHVRSHGAAVAGCSWCPEGGQR